MTVKTDILLPFYFIFEIEFICFHRLQNKIPDRFRVLYKRLREKKRIDIFINPTNNNIMSIIGLLSQLCFQTVLLNNEVTHRYE